MRWRVKRDEREARKIEHREENVFENIFFVEGDETVAETFDFIIMFFTLYGIS